MPRQQTLPTWFALNACDDRSPSGIVDMRTGDTQFVGGLNLGDYFELTEKEANSGSYTTNGILHAGQYRRVQVHEGATAANVKVGHIGGMVTSLIPELNIVTSADHITLSVPRLVVFLNTVTPGNFCFIQELGIASVVAGGSVSLGDPGSPGTTGTVTNSSTHKMGVFLDHASANSLARIILELPLFQG